MSRPRSGPTRATIRPRGPYRLDQSAWGTGGGTRRWHGRVLRIALRPPSGPATATVRQRHDGAIDASVTTDGDAEDALTELRRVLALDVDPEPFMRMAQRDSLLGPLVGARPGLRPARLGSVAQAAVAALAGQLVTGREAARTHARIVGLVAARRDDLRLPPDTRELRSASVARLRSAGLASRRAATLARLVRAGDLERLHRVPSDSVSAWAAREPGLGAWSAGVIGLYGLGRYDLGLVGDLGLIRLAGALAGRDAGPEDTARLLEPYGEWSGLASVHLLHHRAARERRVVARAVA